jgi:hypothetical protein
MAENFFKRAPKNRASTEMTRKLNRFFAGQSEALLSRIGAIYRPG